MCFYDVAHSCLHELVCSPHFLGCWKSFLALSTVTDLLDIVGVKLGHACYEASCSYHLQDSRLLCAGCGGWDLFTIKRKV